MISERQFAHKFSNFWSSTTPMITSIVKQVNSNLYQNYLEPIKLKGLDSRRGLVNETGFLIFHFESLTRRLNHSPSQKSIDQATATAQKKIERLEGTAVDSISQEELTESIALYQSLYFFWEYQLNKRAISTLPFFPGCGIVEGCEGDILAGDTLFEVKAGDGNFKGVDLKQVLTYCALSKNSDSQLIKSIGLVNPRQGKYFLIDIDELSFLISGLSSSDLLHKIVLFLAGGEVSK
ncbi:MAG: hypothetical protein KDD50_03295 [Bdellovibrionales bacterium]|nr:hypothetical protein [Bdellovibrionales bacterium]